MVNRYSQSTYKSKGILLMLANIVIALLSIGVVYLYVRWQLALTEAAAVTSEKQKLGKSNYRLLKQNRELQTFATQAQVDQLSLQHQYYSLTKGTIVVSEYSAVDADQLLAILHTVIANNGFYGHRDNINALLEMLYGKERKQWPWDLQHNNRLPEGYAVAWRGSSVHPPQQMYQIITSFEAQAVQQKVNANHG
jgi:hypothetical protein